MVGTAQRRETRRSSGRRLSALILLLPLICLQSLEAASLYCDGLAHANLLSVGCPHHAEAASGGESNTTDGRDGAEAGHVPSNGDDERGHDCSCPRSGNSLPDGLIQLVLGGVGIPVGATTSMEILAESPFLLPDPLGLRSPPLSYLEERPPKG